MEGERIPERSTRCQDGARKLYLLRLDPVTMFRLAKLLAAFDDLGMGEELYEAVVQIVERHRAGTSDTPAA